MGVLLRASRLLMLFWLESTKWTVLPRQRIIGRTFLHML
jgi:hypothetical protein